MIFDRERRRTRRLLRAERTLKDAVHHLDKWGFGNTPSEDEDERARIHRLIREVESLGGDAEECIDAVYTRWDKTYMLAEAMPETFERTKDSYSNHWTTRRIGTC